MQQKEVIRRRILFRLHILSLAMHLDPAQVRLLESRRVHRPRKGMNTGPIFPHIQRAILALKESRFLSLEMRRLQADLTWKEILIVRYEALEVYLCQSFTITLDT